MPEPRERTPEGGGQQFHRQTAKFRTLAKATQAKYGTIKIPAAHE
jgi:hypothetical protein